MKKHIALEGQTFGRLKVLNYEGTSDYGIALWKVRCSCGTEFVAYSMNLRKGYTKSCGCLRSEMTAARNAKRRVGNDQ